MVALALLGTSATIFFAWNLATFIADVFIGRQPVELAFEHLIWAALTGAGKAITIWLQELLSVRASISTKSELRAKFFEALANRGPGWLAKQDSSELAALATTGLDALDAYFAKYLPQLVFTALVTPIFTVVIFMQDAGSGWTLLATIPLIPLFMILIGWATRSVQQRQLDALFRLSSHFLQLLRGLTTLRIFGRTDAQTESMRAISESYRSRTMKVLRISFLSGFALELLASLSVALIAVSIGLRLVNGELSLAIGLFVLLLAPEAYLPLRMVGANFHAAAEGVAASKQILDIIDEASDEANPDDSLVTQARLGEVTLLAGPSGAGKTSQVRAWLGFDRIGRQSNSNIRQTAWLPQQIGLFAGTVSENIAGIGSPVDDSVMSQAISMAALDDISINLQVGVGGSALSGGQQQRVGIARAFYRALSKDCETLILDEPVSALDDRRASVVSGSIREFAKRGLRVVVVSHQTTALDFDRIIEVTARG